MNAPLAARLACWRPQDLAELARRLAVDGPEALARLTLARRLQVWNETVALFLDPGSGERRALLPELERTARLSPAGLAAALEVVLGGVDSAAAAALTARLPPLGARRLGGVVLASNVPALAVQSLLPALLLGRPLIVKSSSREPLFAPAFVAALTRCEPALGDAFAAVAWRGEETELAAAAFAPCDRVLAYGGAAAVGALARELGDRLVAFGPRASVALVTGDAERLATAEGLANDIALLDQRGCLSVQAVYVAGGRATKLAAALAAALAETARRLPPGPIEAGDAAGVQQLRAEAALRCALVGDLELREGSVVLARGVDFAPVPGLRAVRIHAVADLDAALAALASWKGQLQGAALAGSEATARAAEIASRLGLARVAPAGKLQHAAAGWASGGIDPLAALA